MKRIKQEIKKNSQNLIESSLPEISSLDNIQIKPKKTRNFPIILAPIGAACACIALVAALVPTIMKSGTTPVITSSSSNYGSSGSNSGYTNNILSRLYDLDGTQPKCDDFGEAAYYSYLAYNQESNINTKTNYVLRSKNKKAEGTPGTYEELRERYTDNYGRLHRPIPLDFPITFSDFLFFEFDTQKSVFLDERIGNGHIKGVVIQNSYLEEDMIILKNGEKMYSCLRYGGAPYRQGKRAYFQFSANRVIEGFEYVTESANRRFITLYFSGTTEGERELDTLSAINVDGYEYPIAAENVFYDSSSIVCTIDEIRERFGLDAFVEVTPGYGGPDQLVYDASVPETANFTLDEFEEAFRVTQNEVFLGDNKILDINGTNKIYASEINRDSHRELVFESIKHNRRTFFIYDVYHNRFLYEQIVSTIKYDYNFELDMKDNHLVVKWLEPGMTSDEYILDYGVFAYHGNEGIGISWNDELRIGWLDLKGVYQADGVTPVECVDGHYYFTKQTQFIIEMEVVVGEDNPLSFVREEHPIGYTPYRTGNMPNETMGWEQVSVNASTYRYKVSFQESGFSYYTVYFYHYSFFLKAAVDVSLD